MRVNYAAVVVSAVLYWLLGALWYGVLFGKQWMALEGLKMEQLQQQSPTVPYIIAMLANLVLASVLARICVWKHADTAVKGAALGVLLWIGFIATTSFTTYLFEGRSKQLFLINYGYSLVGLLLMGAILGAWKKKPAA